MDERNLAERFQADRPRLTQLAYRMLGSLAEAEDAVQDAWLRLSRSDTDEVGNLSGWLTTVVARICLDSLRKRKSRREEPAGPDTPEPAVAAEADRERELADSVGLAMLIVLEALDPAERVAFVLHDMFDLPFDEIASVLGCSTVATRQLASRARRRVQGSDPSGDAGETVRRRQVVDAFLAASRGGDFAALLELLDPDVVLRADPAAVAMGTNALVRGPQGVAEVFSGRAKALRHALIDGAPGLVWALRGEPKVVFAFTVEDGRVTRIEQLADLDGVAVEFA